VVIQLMRTLRKIIIVAVMSLVDQSLGQAGSFQVNPIRVTLTSQVASVLINVRNENTDSLRIQVEAAAWNQTKQGEMQLAPTKEIAFYPTLMSIAPGEERNIRVAAKTTPQSLEKTYRIFITELPDAAKSKTAAVRMLTRFSIPIFLQPEKSSAQLQIDQFNWQRGEFSFELMNNGNVHSLPRDIWLKGTAADGTVVFEKQLAPWYVLARSSREYRGELPKTDCAKIKTLTVQVELEGKTIKEILQLPPNACV
jgi:fimbrial chaperone protein